MTLAAIRPDGAWEASLFLHIAGAMLLVGGLFVVSAALLWLRALLCRRKSARALGADIAEALDWAMPLTRDLAVSCTQARHIVQRKWL